MRKRTLLILPLLLFAAAPSWAADAPRWGRLYILSGDVPVRETPADSALKVRVLKAGQKVRADFTDQDWTAVFDPKEPVRSELRALGYAKLAELRSRGTLELAQATSIEVHRPEARPLPKPDAKVDAKVDAKPARAAAKPRKAEPQQKSAKAFGEIRVADRALTVRKSRTKDSDFVRLLKPGQPVRVDFLEDGWYAVFDPDELTRDLSRAWGYSRDKYLVPEAAYAGPPAPADEKAAPKAQPDKPGKPAKDSADDGAVGYSVIDRKDVHRKTSPAASLRVRLELTQPPAVDALKKIAREIWKAERRKNEDLALEIYLTGMDPQGLAYAVARFHDDGRLREFWRRDVVLGKARK